MAYTVSIFDDRITSVNKEGLTIPVNPANRHYQAVLDAIIAEGADCFDGDIPAELQAAADAKLAAGLYQPDPHA